MTTNELSVWFSSSRGLRFSVVSTIHGQSQGGDWTITVRTSGKVVFFLDGTPEPGGTFITAPIGPQNEFRFGFRSPGGRRSFHDRRATLENSNSKDI